MALPTPVVVSTGQDGVKLYVYQFTDGTDTIVPGTDTLATAGIPVGGAREVVVEVVENAATVATMVVEGTLDPAEGEYFGLTDALSAGVISIDVSTGEQIIEILQPCLFLRCRLTTSTSGDMSIRVMVIK